ncbi:MAG: hypothetical protein JW841_10630 [Deltaproteobacteria bacterium]|nr:hypothetical protein [Deltaproteobacteria bacterium]
MRKIISSKELDIGIISDVVVLHYKDNATVEGIQIISNAQIEQYITNEKVDVVVVLDQVSKPPNEEVRKKIQNDILNHFAKKINALAFVIRGNSFFKVGARAVISGILLFTKVSFSTKVVSTIDEALTWLKTVTSHDYVDQLNQDIRTDIEFFCKTKETITS